MTDSTITLLARSAAAAADQALADRATTMAAGYVVADVLACTMIGGSHPTVQRLAAVQNPASGHGVGRSLSVPTGDRMLLDAIALDVTAAHVDELDPVHPVSASLPAAPAVHAALHVGADVDAPSRRFLGAVVAGYEVAARAALWLGGPRLYQQSWWPGAVTGRLAAASAAAYVLELNQDQTVQALALASAAAGGLLTEDLFADGHYVMLGDAAVNGVQAALRAAAGLRGAHTLLDGPAHRAFNLGQADRPDIEPESGKLHLTDGMHKEFPCATPLQGVIRGLQALGGVEILTDATKVEVALPAPTLAFVSCDREVAGPPEAAASLAHAIGAVRAGRAHDVHYFRAADAGKSWAGELVLRPGQPGIVDVAVTRNGRRVEHRQPIRGNESAADLLTRRHTRTGTGDVWANLVADIDSGAAPRSLGIHIIGRGPGNRLARIPSN